jgi:hypothetical protein
MSQIQHRQFLIITAAFLGALGALSAYADELVLEDEATATAEAGYGRVFGRIVVIEGGKERSFSRWDAFQVRLRSLKTDQDQPIPLGDDGNFYWQLKPGEYVIQNFNHGGSRWRFWITFTAPEPGKAAYVGHLRVTLDRKRISIEFADEYEAALQRIEPRLAKAKLEPLKALMRPEERLGSYQSVIGICAKPWALGCDGPIQGLIPAQPEGTLEGYPTTSSRTPLFEWKPSAIEGVAYDLAIYEAWTSSTDFLGLFRDRGKLIFYAEGIREPRYQLESPLPADRKYMWSVRLRKGDTVSTWSGTGYFVFLIVGSVSGSGKWYGFETPAK